MGLTRIAVRVPDDILERIRTLTQTWPGNPTESYVVRYLIEQGLEVLEQGRQSAGRSGLSAPEAR